MPSLKRFLCIVMVVLLSSLAAVFGQTAALSDEQVKDRLVFITNALDAGQPRAVIMIAQMIHETGALTSWWSQRPRRNPAGIGVTGQTRPEKPATGAWQFDEQAGIWKEGVAFPSWKDDSIPAHVGRMLAYALKDSQANDAQRALIALSLFFQFAHYLLHICRDLMKHGRLPRR